MTFEFKRDISRSNFQIGNIVVIPTRDILVHDNVQYELEPLVMDLLCVLAEKPGEVMMRDTLINRLWNLDNGGDENLTRAISVLRKTLREANQGNVPIETIPKRGYRLTYPVTKLDEAGIATNSSFLTPNEVRKTSLLPTALIVLLAAIPVVMIVAIAG